MNGSPTWTEGMTHVTVSMRPQRDGGQEVLFFRSGADAGSHAKLEAERGGGTVVLLCEVRTTWRQEVVTTVVRADPDASWR